MKHIAVFILPVLFLVWSCGNSGKDSEKINQDSSDTLMTNETEEKITNVEPGDVITILGDNVNMRTQDKIGDNVIMQLDSGSKTTLITRGRKEQIGDMVDFWYKVSYNDRDMWVYGALTSAKSKSLNPELEQKKTPDNVVTGTFIEIVEKNDNSYFVMKDEKGKQQRFLIYGGYEGQQIFADNPEDMKGFDISITWENQKVFLESKGENVEVNRIMKVEPKQ